MVHDTQVAQARELLQALHQEAAATTRKLEVVERRGHRTSVRGSQRDRRLQSALRQQLFEAHRLIDGLHRRFPETRLTSAGQRSTSPRTAD